MSAHGDHDEAHADAGDVSDTDHHDAAPSLDEPATPLWLTLLGVGLFLTGGILFVATREPGKTTAELTASPSAAPAESAVPSPVAPPAPGLPQPAGQRPGTAPGAGVAAPQRP